MPAGAPMTAWRCGECTYVHDTAASVRFVRCAVCGTPRSVCAPSFSTAVDGFSASQPTTSPAPQPSPMIFETLDDASAYEESDASSCATDEGFVVVGGRAMTPSEEPIAEDMEYVYESEAWSDEDADDDAMAATDAVPTEAEAYRRAVLESAREVGEPQRAVDDRDRDVVLAHRLASFEAQNGKDDDDARTRTSKARPLVKDHDDAIRKVSEPPRSDNSFELDEAPAHRLAPCEEAEDEARPLEDAASRGLAPPPTPRAPDQEKEEEEGATREEDDGETRPTARSRRERRQRFMLARRSAVLARRTQHRARGLATLSSPRRESIRETTTTADTPFASPFAAREGLLEAASSGSSEELHLAAARLRASVRRDDDDAAEGSPLRQLNGQLMRQLLRELETGGPLTEEDAPSRPASFAATLWCTLAYAGDVDNLGALRACAALFPATTPPNALNATGLAPLHCAGDAAVASYLIEDLGVDVDARTRTARRTPLLLACERGDAALVRVLLAAGADANAAALHGATPVTAAVPLGKRFAAYPGRRGSSASARLSALLAKVECARAARRTTTVGYPGSEAARDAVLLALLDAGADVAAANAYHRVVERYVAERYGRVARHGLTAPSGLLPSQRAGEAVRVRLVHALDSRNPSTTTLGAGDDDDDDRSSRPALTNDVGGGKGT